MFFLLQILLFGSDHEKYKKWKRLFTETVSANKKLFPETVSANKKLFTETGVPIEKKTMLREEVYWVWFGILEYQMKNRKKIGSNMAKTG